MWSTRGHNEYKQRFQRIQMAKIFCHDDIEFERIGRYFLKSIEKPFEKVVNVSWNVLVDEELNLRDLFPAMRHLYLTFEAIYFPRKCNIAFPSVGTLEPQCWAFKLCRNRTNRIAPCKSTNSTLDVETYIGIFAEGCDQGITKFGKTRTGGFRSTQTSYSKLWFYAFKELQTERRILAKIHQFQRELGKTRMKSISVRTTLSKRCFEWHTFENFAHFWRYRY